MVIEIPLTQNKVALIDDEDYDLISGSCWRAKKGIKTYYARRDVVRPNGTRSTQLMHTLITGWFQVDHSNGDGLDNRKENLRKATTSQNHANISKRSSGSSSFKGVDWHKRTRKWRARVMKNYEDNHIGYFDNEEDAARAYDRMALIVFGKFAKLNFPK